MNISRIGILFACIVLVSLFAGCKVLALNGAQKYKVDLTNVLMKIQDEINNDGKVSDKTYTKYEKFLEKSKDEYYNKGSYEKAEQIMECLQKARSDSANAFYQYQNAKIIMNQCFDLLKTEVAD